MNTEELTRLYQSIEVGDDSVRQVLDAMPGRAVRSGRAKRFVPSTPVVALTTVLLLFLIGGLVYGGLLRNGDRHAPTGHSSAPASAAPTASAPATVRLPVRRSNTVSGAVLSNGRPQAGAYVSVQLWPNGSIQDHLKKGQQVPTKKLPEVRTDAHGGFVVLLGSSELADRRYREGAFINFEIDVFVGDRMAYWNGTFRVHHNAATPVQMVFDFGAKTIRVDGRTSKITIM